MSTRLALVTGGASGIGAATAQRLAEEGWEVAVADLDATGPGAYALDVTDEAAVAELVASLGPVSGLVNSAGVTSRAPVLELKADELRRVLDVNLVGTFLVSRAVGARMAAEGGGAIVNLASIAGLAASAGRGAYGASKAAVISLTKTMALELGGCGVRVNAVAPGATETPLVQQAHTDEDRAHYAQAVPLGRYAQAGEIASVIAFLLDDARAGYLTGEVLAVDGGLAARR